MDEDDDVAPTPGDVTFVVEVEPDLAEVVEVRRRAIGEMEAVGHPTPGLQDLAVVLSELLTNAVESGTTMPIGLDLRAAAGRAQVVVTNAVGEADVPPRREWSPDTLLAARGRGLSVVEAMSQDVFVEHGDGEVVVRALVPLSDMSSPAGRRQRRV